MKTFITISLITLALYSNGQTHTTENNCKKSLEYIDGMKTISITEKMPEYKGGFEQYMRLVAKNLKYPTTNQPELQSSILVGFVIDTLGHVRNECVINQFDKKKLTPMEIEVMRVVKLLQDWKPGQQNGKKVPVQLCLPITVCLR